MRTTISDDLQHLNKPDLVNVARVVGVHASMSRSKAQHAEAIRERLANTTSLAALIRRMSAADRAALAMAAYAPDGIFDEDAFTAIHGQASSWRDNRHSVPDNPSLLWAFIPRGRVPDDIRDDVTKLLDAPRAPRIRTVAEPSAAIDLHDGAGSAAVRACEREAAAQRELAAVLRLVSLGAVPSDTHADALSAAITPALGADGDFYDAESVGSIRTFAWPQLLLAAGMARCTKQRMELTSSGRRALDAPAAGVCKTLWRSWLQSDTFDEMTDVLPHVARSQLTEAAPRRRVVADALRACPLGKWVAVEDLLRYMRARSLRFDVLRDPYAVPASDWNDDNGMFGDYGEAADWALEMVYSLTVLFTYAATLGLVDVAYTPPAHARDYGDFYPDDDHLSVCDGLAFLRLTALGAFCLGLSDGFEVPDGDEPPAFNADLTVDAPHASAEEHVVLERYAHELSPGRWRLDRESLLNALAQGAPPSQLLAFAQRSGRALPPSLRALVRDVEERRLASSGPAQLFSCCSAQRADELLADPELARLALRAGPTTLAVPVQHDAAFRARVRTLDHVADSS